MPLSDYLPDFSDPQSMAAWGALGNVLIGGSAPRYAPNGNGVTGGNALNSLAALAGLGLTGAVKGAEGAQQYKASDLANQMGQLGLQKQQAVQPLQIAAIKNAMGGVPGNLAGPGSQVLSQMPPSTVSDADQKFAQAYNLSMAFSPDKAAGVLQSWAEHNPQLAGMIKNEQERQSIIAMPGGRQVPGSAVLSPYGSLSPSAGGGAGVPAPQLPMPAGQMPPNGAGASPAIPQIPASQLFAPPQGQSQPGPTAQGVDPNDPIAVAGATEAAKQAAEVAAAGSKKESEEQGSNLAESVNQYNSSLSNFQAVHDRIAEMHQAADNSSFNAGNDEKGSGPITFMHRALGDKTSVANSRLEQLKEQGLISQIGPQLAATGAKGNKLLEGIITGADSLDLAAGKPAIKSQIDGLYANYIKNMVSQNQKIKLSGGKPEPLPPIMMKTPKGIGTVTPSHVEEVLKAGGSFVF